MRRIGSATLSMVATGLVLSGTASGEVLFRQSADRETVGLSDVFRVTIEAAGVDGSAEIELPASEDFEILSRSQSTQMAYQFGGGGFGSVNRTTKYVLMMRANRVGRLTIPPAMLRAEGRSYRTDPIELQVIQGQSKRPAAPRPDPFISEDDLEDELDISDLGIPRNNSDLFVRAALDKEEVYVGEQVNFSVHLFSRVDISSVESLTLPKLEGFWSEDLESPNQLGSERRLVDGIPYRVFLLKRRALFPVKAGQIKVGTTGVDIVSGFMFTGSRIHRDSNPLSLRVKPLPSGAPPGFDPGAVGDWRLVAEVDRREVELGQPVTFRLILEGEGNLKKVSLPRLEAPGGLRVFDPKVSDQVTVRAGRIGGRRTAEYLVIPQQTGAFTLPSVELPYFNVQEERYRVAKTLPIDLRVEGGSGRAGVPGGPSVDSDDAAKNILSAGGIRPLRHRAEFRAPAPAIWDRPYFVPAVLLPPGLWAAVSLVGLFRGRLRHEDEETRRKKKTRAAKSRLSAAEKLRAGGSGPAFFGEVEKALLTFLEAKLGASVTGLTRQALDDTLHAAGISTALRGQVREVLDGCDLGRFAPGAGGDRGALLERAASVIDGWEAR